MIILGAGPAGVSAAIYAARAGIDTLWLDRRFEAGGQMTDTYEIDNYPGMPGVSGMELAEAMGAHAEKLGMELVRDSILSIEDAVEADGSSVRVLRSRKHEYRCRALILAGGATHRHLGIPGEEEFSGMGVSYCATCDGAFFKGKTVAVVGGGNTAVEDAMFLARVCEQVYLIHRRGELRADQILQQQLRNCKNVEILWNQVPLSIDGVDKVETITIQSTRSGISQQVDVDGVFIAVGIVPNNKACQGLVAVDDGGYILAGEDCVTDHEGIFAAGDIRSKRLRQVVTAVADGANAVKSVQDYLADKCVK